MKSLITYYSYSGNTDAVAQIFAKVLRNKGDVDVQRLKPRDEIRAFIAQCQAAFLKKRAELEGKVNFDAGSYDLVLIGSPVWAFAPTPAINTLLDKISGLNGKKVIIFLTSGSGAGVKRCFGNIAKVLKAKGASEICEINIPDRRIKDENFVTASIIKYL